MGMGVHKTVLGCRQILAAPVPVVVLYLVDKLRRMLQAHTYGYAFRLNLYLRFGKVAIDITRRMPRSENHGATECHLRTTGNAHRLNADNHAGADEKACHLGLEVHLAATFYNSVAHVLNHLRQLVGADMGMGVGKNGCRCTMLAEHIENLFYASTFLRARI